MSINILFICLLRTKWVGQVIISSRVIKTVKGNDWTITRSTFEHSVSKVFEFVANFSFIRKRSVPLPNFQTCLQRFSYFITKVQYLFNICKNSIQLVFHFFMFRKYYNISNPTFDVFENAKTRRNTFRTENFIFVWI